MRARYSEADTFDHLVAVGRHARIGQQEVEDGVGRQWRLPGQFFWSVLMPEPRGLGLAAGALMESQGTGYVGALE